MKTYWYWMLLLTVGALLSASPSSLQAQGTLYGSSNENAGGTYFAVDIATGAGTLVGSLPADVACTAEPIGITEIEYDPASGRAFAQAANGAFCGAEFNVADGSVIGGAIPNGGAYNGLEVINGTWYGTAIGGPGGPSELRTINPFTGVSSLVGATGVGPISGLAYDEGSGTLYGIAGGPGPANLYTLNMATGVATVVGSTGIQAGSLEFGPDGQLYAGATGGGGGPTLAAPGDLYRINPATGAATLVGSTGFSNVTGLMLAAGPEADLGLAKECVVPDTETASFHLDLFNDGPDPATAIHVQDWLSPSVTVTDWSTTQGSFDPSTGLWDVGDLVASGLASLWIDVTLGGTGLYENHAEVVAVNEADPDSTPDDGQGDDFDACSFLLLGDRVVPDFVPETGPGGVINRGNRFTADLILDKSVDNDAPSVGDEITYTLSIFNAGPQSTARVAVTDVLPACLGFVSAAASRGAYDEMTGVWNVGKLKLSETATLDIVVAVTADCSGTVMNTALVSSSSLPDPLTASGPFDPQATIENNRSEASFTVQTTQARVLAEDGVVLGRNYPNPFNPTTTIPFSVDASSEVHLAIYDLLGRRVGMLVDGVVTAGSHTVVFEASRLPTGVYLVRMEAGGTVQTQRITLMK